MFMLRNGKSAQFVSQSASRVCCAVNVRNTYHISGLIALLLPLTSFADGLVSLSLQSASFFSAIDQKNR